MEALDVVSSRENALDREAAFRSGDDAVDSSIGDDVGPLDFVYASGFVVATVDDVGLLAGGSLKSDWPRLAVRQIHIIRVPVVELGTQKPVQHWHPAEIVRLNEEFEAGRLIAFKHVHGARPLGLPVTFLIVPECLLVHVGVNVSVISDTPDIVRLGVCIEVAAFGDQTGVDAVNHVAGLFDGDISNCFHCFLLGHISSLIA